VATDIVDPAYDGAVEVCDWTEGEIIRQHAPEDGEAAAAAMREARAMCDGREGCDGRLPGMARRAKPHGA
jgi:hypothetical protein